MADAAIVVTTKNRRDELSRLLESVRSQTADLEVIVIDDHSTDGTFEMVAERYPEVRLERGVEPGGFLVQRNFGARLATARIIVSLDDDAVFESARTVEQTLADFDDPRVGAVAIPFVDVRTGPAVHQRAPDRIHRYAMSSFRGTAYAVVKEVFLACGGFREDLIGYGEEGDFCLRMLAAGLVTRMGNADSIHHRESPRRDRARQFFLWSRNDVLHGWHNVPAPYLPGRWAKVLVHWSIRAVQTGYARAIAGGLIAGFRGVWSRRRRRRAVPVSVYRLDRRLRHQGAVPIDSPEAALPEPRFGSSSVN